MQLTITPQQFSPQITMHNSPVWKQYYVSVLCLAIIVCIVHFSCQFPQPHSKVWWLHQASWTWQQSQLHSSSSAERACPWCSWSPRCSELLQTAEFHLDIQLSKFVHQNWRNLLATKLHNLVKPTLASFALDIHFLSLLTNMISCFDSSGQCLWLEKTD